MQGKKILSLILDKLRFITNLLLFLFTESLSVWETMILYGKMRFRTILAI